MGSVSSYPPYPKILTTKYERYDCQKNISDQSHNPGYAIQKPTNTANISISMCAPVYGFPNPRAVAIFVNILRVINQGAIRSDDHLSTFYIIDN